MANPSAVRCARPGCGHSRELHQPTLGNICLVSFCACHELVIPAPAPAATTVLERGEDLRLLWAMASDGPLIVGPVAYCAPHDEVWFTACPDCCSSRAEARL